MDIAVKGSVVLMKIRIILYLFFSIGNHTVDARASPILFDTIVEAAKMVRLLIRRITYSPYNFFHRFKVLMILLVRPYMINGRKFIGTMQRMNRSTSENDMCLIGHSLLFVLQYSVRIGIW